VPASWDITPFTTRLVAHNLKVGPGGVRFLFEMAGNTFSPQIPDAECCLPVRRQDVGHGNGHRNHKITFLHAKENRDLPADDSYAFLALSSRQDWRQHHL
jgi:hypothetical protein